jgi:hypothetical protein
MKNELSNADDIGKLWPKSDLLPFLGFPKPALSSLYRWNWGKQGTVSLDDVFELVISSGSDLRPGYLVSKMLDVQCIGRVTFLKVVTSMAGINFGNQCNLIWNDKCGIFLGAKRVKGNRRFDQSFSITNEDKQAVKIRIDNLYRDLRLEKTTSR